MRVTGFHHVTCIGSHPRGNLHFYRDLLGLRLLKRTVHFDHEDVYHLYYGDELGTPGAILTFFPFPDPKPAARGSKAVQEVALAIPAGSQDYWWCRLQSFLVDADRWTEERGRDVLRFRDGDGQRLKLVASPGMDERACWAGGSVPAEQALRGLEGVELGVLDLDREVDFRSGRLGLVPGEERSGVLRLGFAGSRQPGRWVDVRAMPGVPAAPPLPLEGAPHWAGTVNHVAFGTEDERTQLGFRESLLEAGLTLTPVKDRLYFKSVYMIDPGGIRVEIATDDCAGFAFDEPPSELGTALKLPPWLEHLRPAYEASLPALE